MSNSRLNPRGAAIYENNFQVDDKIATVVVKAKMNGEMYVDGIICVTLLLIFVIIGFEADNKSTAIFRLWKVSHHKPLELTLRVMGKIQKLFSNMILPSEAQSCDLVLHEVRMKTTEMA